MKLTVYYSPLRCFILSWRDYKQMNPAPSVVLIGSEALGHIIVKYKEGAG